MNEERHVPEGFDQQEAMQQLPSPGAVLREIRERRGESLSDVAFSLKLSYAQVVALEEERLDELPGLTFIKGFYRNYARHLGVDIEELLAARWAEPQAEHVNLAPVRNAVGALPNGIAGVRFGRYAGWLAGVLVLVLLLGWYFDGFRLDGKQAREVGAVQEENLAANDGESGTAEMPSAGTSSEVGMDVSAAGLQAFQEEETIGEPIESPVTEEELSALESESELAPGSEAVLSREGEERVEDDAADEETVAEADAAETTVAQDGTDNRMTFHFDEEVWLEVRDAKNRTVYAGLNPGGTTRSVQAEPPLNLTIGNAAQVKLEFNGQAIDLAPHTGASGVARLTLEGTT